MPANGTVGSVFLRENTVLPAGLLIETEAFLPGWRAVKNCDGYALGRKIEEAKWNFFYLVGEVKVIVLGRVGPQALCAAFRRLLVNPAGRKFNSAEITKVTPGWFLGFPFVSVMANFRHIQQSLTLAPAKEFAPRISAAADALTEANNYVALVPSS